MIPEVKFEILYGLSEEFLNYLLEAGYVLRDVNVVKAGFTACCDAADYRHIRRAVKKYQCKIRILEKRGIYFKIRKFLKRKGLIAGVAVFMLSCFLFSKIIWRIDINAADDIKKGRIAAYLFENNVYPGVIYDGKKMDDLKSDIMLRQNDVSYIAFNFYKGVLECIVYPVKEKEKYTDIESENNIYSRLSGIITDLRVYTGFSRVGLGQSVSRGDLLVSNVTTDKFGFVSVSDTSVYIEGICEKDYSLFVPYKSTRMIYTGRLQQKKELYFMNKAYVLKSDDFDESGNYSQRTYIKYGDIMGFKLPYTIKVTNRYMLENTETETDVLNAYTKAKNRITKMINEDKKLKEEYERTYDYSFNAEGVTFACTVKGRYEMT